MYTRAGVIGGWRETRHLVSAVVSLDANEINYRIAPRAYISRRMWHVLLLPIVPIELRRHVFRPPGDRSLIGNLFAPATNGTARLVAFDSFLPRCSIPRTRIRCVMSGEILHGNFTPANRALYLADALRLSYIAVRYTERPSVKLYESCVRLLCLFRNLLILILLLCR